MENTKKPTTYFSVILRREFGLLPSFCVFAVTNKWDDKLGDFTETKRYLHTEPFKDEAERDCKYFGRDTAYQNAVQKAQFYEKSLKDIGGEIKNVINEVVYNTSVIDADFPTNS